MKDGDDDLVDDIALVLEHFHFMTTLLLASIFTC